ncbi:MAG: aminotransferase class V-fold PLP-dependent enzyme [Planctomycetes bacterium]|nr:aminotransferase class V-fold PLP-dependent enzyme [Planctomycetota bacterium]
MLRTRNPGRLCNTVTSPMPCTRRNFLAAPAILFAFRDGTARELDRLDFSRAAPDDDAFWLELREQFDLDPTVACFNHAGLSPSTRAVREAMAAQVLRANHNPSRVLWREQDHELDVVRERLARLLGCSADELALTPNATYGLHTVILGLGLHAGDEILTTTHDYSRAHQAMRQRQRRDHTVTVAVELATPCEAPEVVARQILDRVTPRTRLVALSQMTFLTGQQMPIRAVAAELAKLGIPLLVDGAHGIGLLPDTLQDLGGAFYTACLHKWLMGPLGTGVFVARSNWIDKVWPLQPGEEGLDNRITKFEQGGTRPAAPLLALREALDFHERLGPRKAARLEALRQRLAAPLLAESGIRHCGSLDPNICRAMLTIEFAKVEPRPLAAWLWTQHRIHVTTAVDAGLRALRISPHVFTTHAEVDRLATILVGVARNGI